MVKVTWVVGRLALWALVPPPRVAHDQAYVACLGTPHTDLATCGQGCGRETLGTHHRWLVPNPGRRP